MPKHSARSAGLHDVEIGKRIKAHRRMKGLSQADLAEMLGVSFQQVQKYEKGVNRISAGRVDTICERLDVSRDDLLGEVGHTPSGDTDLIMDFLSKPQGARFARLASRLNVAQCAALNGFISLMLAQVPARS